MALATQEDVEAALGRSLTTAETDRIASLLVKASAVVIGHAGQDFEPAPYPEVVTVVVADMVARALQQGAIPAGVEQATENVGPFARSFRYGGGSSGDVWLSAADKLALRAHRRGGGLTSVQAVGERYEITES